MKKRILNVVTILAITIAFVGCKDKADEANTSEAKPAAVSESTDQKYIVDVSESVIEWKGFKPTGTHNGTVNIENGVVQVDKGMPQSGTFLIDMTSIVSLDTEGKSKENLEAHLKGTVEGKEGDFFNVTKFPDAAFEITGAEAQAGGKVKLSGNLTIKGVENNISFPVTISEEGDMITMTSDSFTIDRTKWNVNYGSKSVFDNLGDKFINDEMELKITVKARKS